jgi:hypothetical protein
MCWRNCGSCRLYEETNLLTKKHAMSGIKYGISVTTYMIGRELGYMEKNRNMSDVLNVVVLCVLNILILLIF